MRQVQYRCPANDSETLFASHAGVSIVVPAFSLQAIAKVYKIELRQYLSESQAVVGQN